MGTCVKSLRLTPFVMLLAVAGLLLAGGCARYARTVHTLYEPVANIRGGSGEIYIIIPENKQTSSKEIKWVLGKVKDDDNNIIDEVYSSHSQSEIIQAAFVMEFKKAGYTVISTTKLPAGGQRVLDLTKTEIAIEQVSDFADLKAKCRILVGMDVFVNGQQIKRLQYEATSSKTGIKDRDNLAREVLDDAMQSAMLKAMPELHSLLKQ